MCQGTVKQPLAFNRFMSYQRMMVVNCIQLALMMLLFKGMKFYLSKYQRKICYFCSQIFPIQIHDKVLSWCETVLLVLPSNKGKKEKW